MKFALSIILYIALVTQLQGQEMDHFLDGSISYKNTQNVYVKFSSTELIRIGDTLFIANENQYFPALVVKHISSISCVCTPITDQDFDIDDSIIFRRKSMRPQPALTPIDSFALDDEESLIPTTIITPEPDITEFDPRNQSVRGRLSASWYGNFYKKGSEDIHKMRYVFTTNARNINGSKFSAETYLSFRHTLGEWNEVKTNFNRAFKVYNLSVLYEPNPTASILLGRKINYHISNIGAIDGLQAQKRFGKVTTGAFLGSRPDHQDYSINMDLFQFGAYASLHSKIKSGSMQNTLAVVQQYNNSLTDRRFAYFQHTNSIFKKIYVFTSFEVDLFKNENGNATSSFRLTSVYVSLRYRISKKLSLFASYDARNNIIYYETYKNFIDRLIDEETRQGLRFRVNYRPIKYLSFGASGGYRFQTNNSSTAKNAYLYATYSRVPIINASFSISTTLIETSYLTGNIYGVRLTRDIIPGKVFGEIQYRNVNYRYSRTETQLKQNIFSTNISWRIKKRLSLNLYYEGIFGTSNKYNRMHLNITKRF